MASTSSSKPRDPQPRLQALIFPPFEDDGSNYLEWAINAKTHLTVEKLAGAIRVLDRGTQLAVEDISASVCLRALQTLRRHVGYLLQKEYI